MPLTAIILTRDQHVFSQLVDVLQATQLKVEGSLSPGETLVKLQKGRFDAVFIDCGSVPDATDILEALRSGKSNRRAIAFAITEDPHDSQRAFTAGANFVIEKPLSAERVVRALRAAHGLIVRERRRYFRLPLDATVTIESMGKESSRWNIIDVSERGLGAIVPDGQEVPRGSVKIKFRIPQIVEAIEGKALVVWNRTGKVGLEFTTLQPNSRMELDKWIARRFDENERRLASVARR